MSTILSPVVKRERDIRLDFFRGVAMILILFAHITDNPWTLWLPGRFGFSDSTEIFVFCSGLASALAYGAIFNRAGWLVGSGRMIYRVWTVYWVHIGLFMLTMLVMLGINQSGLIDVDQITALNLMPFLNNTGPNLLGLMTLTYVPNYFDVLPMYVALLMMLPFMVAISKVSPTLAMLTSVLVWALGCAKVIWLPAELWFENGSTRPWFFNPFAWQLLFFTGYALGMGWLKPPAMDRNFVILAVAVLLISLPFAYYRIISNFEVLQQFRARWQFLFDKTGFGLLRYVHFLALAYLGYVFAGPGGQRLKALMNANTRIIGFVIDIGRQSLAVFAVSMVLARVLGAILHQVGPGYFVTPAINLSGVVILWLTACSVSWFKGSSWKEKMKPPVDGAGPTVPGRRPVVTLVNELARARDDRAFGAKA